MRNQRILLLNVDCQAVPEFSFFRMLLSDIYLLTYGGDLPFGLPDCAQS